GQGGRVTRATSVSSCGAQTAASASQASRHAHCSQEDDPAHARTWTAHPASWASACGSPPPPGTWQHSPHAGLPRSDDLISPEAWRRRLQAPPGSSTAPTRTAATTAWPDSGVCWSSRGGPGHGRHSSAAASAQSAGSGSVSCVDDASHALP
ncbi:hypothetical protein OY671_012437, partial [Metschnikowia pulcherrima]